ncbi:hypothetical protein [Pseudonocardia sp. T1-2H]|uniref:hypothetical protein n=1 Tax=Pseudonocardia sp. T1-2H TaxID=3128899 RepID=UPI0031016E8D
MDVAERSPSGRSGPTTDPRFLASESPPARGGLVVAAFGGLLGLALFLLARRALIDDAYITLDYARSLAFHGQWALEPGHQANTATSPLNVLLLAGFSLVTRDPVIAAGVLLVVALGVLGWALSSIGRVHGRPLLLPALGVAAVAVCPLLASTVGMETYLAVALIACLARAAVCRRPVEAGAVVGLLVLTRPDLVAFGLAALLVPALFRRALVVVGVAAAVALPWFVTSWLVLGSALPDTVLLKVGDHWGPWNFGNGLLLYHDTYPAAVLLSVLAAGAGVLAAVVTVLVRLVRRRGRAHARHRVGRRCRAARRRLRRPRHRPVPLVLRSRDRRPDDAGGHEPRPGAPTGSRPRHRGRCGARRRRGRVPGAPPVVHIAGDDQLGDRRAVRRRGRGSPGRNRGAVTR